MMGAILYRDADPDVPHPDWRGVRERPGLYLVQPWPRGADAVLSPAELREWDRRIAAKGFILALIGVRTARKAVTEKTSKIGRAS